LSVTRMEMTARKETGVSEECPIVKFLCLLKDDLKQKANSLVTEFCDVVVRFTPRL